MPPCSVHRRTNRQRGIGWSRAAFVLMSFTKKVIKPELGCQRPRRWAVDASTQLGHSVGGEFKLRLAVSSNLWRDDPDITHSVRCQYPTVWWDPSFALTLGRESANPRPVFHKLIQNYFGPCSSETRRTLCRERNPKRARAAIFNWFTNSTMTICRPLTSLRAGRHELDAVGSREQARLK